MYLLFQYQREPNRLHLLGFNVIFLKNHTSNRPSDTSCRLTLKILLYAQWLHYKFPCPTQVQRPAPHSWSVQKQDR